MPDPRFFKKSRTYTLREIAEKTGCVIKLEENADREILDVAPLKTATNTEISFLDNLKYKADFRETKAAACFVTEEMVKDSPTGLTCLITPSPYKAYALTAQLFYPEQRPEARISPKANIHPSVKLGEGCTVEEGVSIAESAEIGHSCWLEPGVVVQRNVKIGNGCHIGASATVSHCLMGDHVRLYPGVRVGQDGFGFAIDKAGHIKVPQLGRVIIGDHVEIGANSTIDRGAGPDTVIGAGTWIDNLVQIGHNVVVGKGCIIVAQVGISGSTQIGDYVAIGGQAGFAGHLKIGQGARIGAQAGVMNDIPPGEEYMGSPAFPKNQFLRQIAALNRLIKKKKDD
ncbi:MAG: UDP-3-O-(3-hydroxymyristoyl)glucosamine N-acyltransferase [Alphaproteobacteria bacterium]|nr:UDP-3-O-(3-hydroxymyristoyl)glucosamine N-acyltransferase [Alphaproteobacteria bacterium]MBP7757752.1 UDP-3-O-(3-hydroxymyristoyl)glucosamine N-acyltransferase [Alphaproteobacteria bacterium]MBP7761048.1 UDP-3-O-(3-hydroxymyristoyl)glucosamine N-acyltransferase [Alphaproteobacteria bacterium]MBP7904578.1 UDP-3-O-(3-hydroxymyristoyl)glucosamine N-acyltransferase [Alphaproteobacteria bacterium]